MYEKAICSSTVQNVIIVGNPFISGYEVRKLRTQNFVLFNPLFDKEIFLGYKTY